MEEEEEEEQGVCAGEGGRRGGRWFQRQVRMGRGGRHSGSPSRGCSTAAERGRGGGGGEGKAGMSMNNDVKLDNYDYFEMFWRKEYTCSFYFRQFTLIMNVVKRSTPQGHRSE